MENYQGSTSSWPPLISQSPGTNYCGIIGIPQRPDELQALRAQRVSDQQAKAWSTRLGEPKADSSPCWNAAWRQPNRQAAQRSHCSPPVDSAQWHSHKPDILSADRSVEEEWCNGAGCVNLLPHMFLLLPHTFPGLCNPTYTEQMCTHTHTCCAHTCPYRPVENKKLQCSRLHRDATHRETCSSPPHCTDNPLLLRNKASTTCPGPKSHYLRRNVDWKKLNKPNCVTCTTCKCYIFPTALVLHTSANYWQIYKENFTSPPDADHFIQLINNWHLSCAGEHSSSIRPGYIVCCCVNPPSIVNNSDVKQYIDCANNNCSVTAAVRKITQIQHGTWIWIFLPPCIMQLSNRNTTVASGLWIRHTAVTQQPGPVQVNPCGSEGASLYNMSQLKSLISKQWGPERLETYPSWVSVPFWLKTHLF